MNKKEFKRTPATKLLDQIDIVELIKNYINLYKKGQNYWALCPFHGDKNPSLCISPSKKIFKCFVCNAKGNAISFVMEFKKIGYSDAIKEIVKIMNISSKELNDFIKYEFNSPLQKTYNMNKQAAFIYNRTLLNSSNKDKLNYLLERNLDLNLIKKHQIGYAPKDKKYLISLMTNANNTLDIDENKDEIWTPIQLLNAGLVNLGDDNEYYDFFWDRILIPIFDEKNNIIGFSGRTLNKKEKIKYINTKTTDAFKKENILYNLNNFDANSYEEIYIVEGYMDVFAFQRMGIENVVASMGTSFTINQINLLKKYKNIKTIIICFDNDDAGFNATYELFEKLIHNDFNVFVVDSYDSRYKDIDELLNKTGKENTLKCIHNSVTFIQYVINKKLKNKQLNLKEKIIESKKIIELINKYGLYSLSLEDEIKSLSLLTGFDVENIKANISIKQIVRKTNNQQQNNIFKKYSNNDIHNISFPEIIFENEQNGNFSNYWKSKYDGLKEKEMKLISLLPLSNILSSIYMQYFKMPYFQDDEQTKSFIRLFLLYIGSLIEQRQSVNIQNLKWIIDADKKRNGSYPEHDIIDVFLSKIENKIYKDEFMDNSINKQGINLMLELYDHIHSLRSQQIYLSNDTNKWDQKKELDIKYHKQRDELNKRKAIIFGKG